MSTNTPTEREPMQEPKTISELEPWEARKEYHAEIADDAKNAINNLIDNLESNRSFAGVLAFFMDHEWDDILYSEEMIEEIDMILCEHHMILNAWKAVNVLNEWSQNPNAYEEVYIEPKDNFYELAVDCAYWAVRADLMDHLQHELTYNYDAIVEKIKNKLLETI